jgi:tRNA(Ile)-lysidine synthetase-like protein
MASDQLIQKVRAFLDTNVIAGPGDRIVVAVSGGPDSLCLLHALVALRATRGFGLHVAHLDHQLRGAESSDDAAFVAEMAARWHVPATIESVDVAQFARACRMNLYAAGRAARYALFVRVAVQQRAQAIAVAHTADDQAETVLLHLLRGAGTAGLSGMRSHLAWDTWAAVVGQQAGASEREAQPGPALVRPLLGITRAEVEAYCTRHALEPRRDASNADTRHTRSRIRHELLPALIEYNPRIIEALCGTAELCADEHDTVERVLDAHWPQLVQVEAAGLAFNGIAWHALSAALQRAALRRAYRLLGGERTLSHERVDAARQALERGVGRRIELPGGLQVAVGYAGNFTIGVPSVGEGPRVLDNAQQLTVPGRIDLQHGWVLAAELCQAAEPAEASSWQCWLRPDALEQMLVVRRRQPGDRMRPAGGAGSRRLQDIMVDAHVPRKVRAQWPVLVSGTQVVWVPGVCVAEGLVAVPGDGPALRIWVERRAADQVD